MLFEKTLPKHGINISVFVCFTCLPWKILYLNSLVFTVFCACFFQNTVDTSVSEEAVILFFPNIYIIPRKLCCESVANSGVFATLPFLVVAQHRKYQCFGSILGVRGEKTS